MEYTNTREREDGGGGGGLTSVPMDPFFCGDRVALGSVNNRQTPLPSTGIFEGLVVIMRCEKTGHCDTAMYLSVSR